MKPLAVNPFPSLLILASLALGAVPAFAQKAASPVLPGGDSKAPVSIDAATAMIAFIGPTRDLRR